MRRSIVVILIAVTLAGCASLDRIKEDGEAYWNDLDERLMALIPEEFRPGSSNTGSDPGKPRHEYVEFGRKLKAGRVTFEVNNIKSSEARNSVGPEAFVCDLVGAKRGSIYSCDKGGGDGRVYFQSDKSIPKGDPKYYKLKKCRAWDDTHIAVWTEVVIEFDQGKDKLNITIAGHQLKGCPSDHYGEYKGIWMGGDGDTRRAMKGYWRNLVVMDDAGEVVVQKE